MLHAHGLIAKIPRSRRWRVTARGAAVMSAAIHYRERALPEEIMKMAELVSNLTNVRSGGA